MPRPARAARPAGAPAWPRRGIERPRGTFVGRRAAATACALCCSRTLYVFGLPGGPAPEASLRAPWVLKGWRIRLRGARGCPPKPENQVKTRRAFSAIRVGWGGAGSRGGGAQHLGRAATGGVDATRFIGKSKQKSKTTRLKPLFTALGVGPALPRLPSAALIADCVSPAQERRAGAAGTAQNWTH